jgi:nucleotide-binding universal stress UspA family protein
MASRPVVVGVDGSEESLRAVEWAAVEAARRKAPLRIVSVSPAPPRARASYLPQMTVSNAVRGMAARALGAGITRSEEVAPGLLIDTDLLAAESPAIAVTDCGAGASLLVVGARGAGGFAALLLGSVSRYAASHGPCPVVVVREQTMAVHHAIVVGVRSPRTATDALSFAFDEARGRGAELVVVHVAHPLPVEEAGQVLVDAEAELAEALHEWQRTYPDVSVRKDVVLGHPAQVLSRYCSRADLLVLGRHDAPGASHSVGSTWRAVLDHASSPVAVVPPGSCPCGTAENTERSARLAAQRLVDMTQPASAEDLEFSVG